MDAINDQEIISFLREDRARVKKFRLAVDVILENIPYREIYDKENIDEDCKSVTAIKMFKGGQNIRLYCKEQQDPHGGFFVIVAKLLPKKKDQKIKAKVKSIIKKIGGYEYEIIQREESQRQQQGLLE